MATNGKRRVPHGIGQPLMQGYEVLRQLAVDPQIARVDIDINYRRGIVWRRAAINGIGIIEPQVVRAQVVERGGIFAAASGDGGLRVLAKAHFAVNIGGKRTKLNGRGRRAAKNCDDQGAQTGAHLYTNRTTTGVNNIIKMGRKKNMAVMPLDIVKTIELQRCAPSINLC